MSSQAVRHPITATIVCFQALFAAGAPAQVIDFETTPNGAASVDNVALGLNDGYVVGGKTITFGFDSNTDGTTDQQAVFEFISGLDSSPHGFSNDCFGIPDQADPPFTSQLGSFFLRQPSALSDFGHFVIHYSGAGVVTAASGEIWDIDGTANLGSEQFQVKAYDASGTLLATLTSPGYAVTGCNASLDGEPWVFQFSNLSAGIARITIDFVGTKTASIGLAFNNFDALGVTVPVEETPWTNVKQLYR